MMQRSNQGKGDKSGGMIGVVPLICPLLASGTSA
jgi:hypothetical protein